MAVANCGNPVQPTPLVTLSVISPSSGPAIGGTAITVTGSNFAPGATLTLGAVPALNVTVIDSTMLTATTPPSPGGTVDVVVVSGGRSATLTGAFTYVRVENAPPVILALTAQGTRPNEPSNFADLNEEINVVATVSDHETPVENLTYEWSSDGGTFIGSGRSVKWRAPTGLPRIPMSQALTLNVIERYQTTDQTGAVIPAENRVSRNVTVHVHNSLKEVSDLVGEFLTDFSNSAVSADSAIRNFSDDRACGKAQERDEIQENRATFTISSSRLGLPPRVTFNFDGVCLIPGRAPTPGDACAQVSCGWTSTRKATGAVDKVDGQCTLSEIHEQQSDQWKLCWSTFVGSSSFTGKPVTGWNFRQQR